MISITQYQQVLPTISDKRKSILLKLYEYGPFANTNQIADILRYESFGAANVQIGTLGRVICEKLNITPKEKYLHNGKWRPSYYTAIHNVRDENGWDLNPNLQKAMERLGWTHEVVDDVERLYTEISSIDRKLYKEGKVALVFVNRYERDKKARAACLKMHGNKCLACDVDFKKMYGDDIDDIIHVHHTRPMGSVKKEENKNIAKDLVPLCPNCHSVVHSTKNVMSVNELKRRIQKNKS